MLSGRSSNAPIVRSVCLGVVLLLLVSACAGSVGKYRNATGTTGELTAEGVPAGEVPGVGTQTQAAGAEVSGVRAAGGVQGDGPTSPGGTGGGSASAPKVSGPKPGSRVGVTGDSVTIGLFYPQTGSYAGLARNFEPAMQAAFAEAGVIHGRKVVLNTYDDGTQNASTIQTNERRAKDESFLYTSIVSESNVVLGPLANQHGVPAIVGNIDRKVALPLTYVFALPTYWATQATLLPSFIRRELKASDKRIGIVYEGTSTAKDARDAFKAKAKAQGMKVVFEQPIAVNQSTCANEGSNLQAHQVEVVYMMTGPLGAICMLRDARAVGFRPTWTGVGLSWSFNVVAQASGGTANGIRTINSVTTLDTPVGKHYSEVMRKHAPNSGADGDDITMFAYGLAVTIAEALRRNGRDLTRESFVATMETKMRGYDSGYYPPVNYEPGSREGGRAVSFSQCCTNDRWTTPDARWRSDL